ncbi:FAD-dependent oxidoreductase [Actinoalloteichus caeruleus]|uniref:FAD-dependent oxidoreductase n=2 Tax=Actinoalloteichus cyanogriseus TaxID=2893586 RepID=UPI003558355A
MSAVTRRRHVTPPVTGRPGRDRKATRYEAPPGYPDTGHLRQRPRVAVVGGGIAGLAAAAALSERGVEVRLLEREPQLGGRVAGWTTTLADGSVAGMNRGFHAFFRQYYNLRGLLRRADPALARLRPVEDYPLLHREGFRDSFARLPRTPPWNALAFVAHSPSFTFGDLARLGTRAAIPLGQVRVPRTYGQLDDLDADAFLAQIRFPRRARHLAFEVFSRSFFAEPTQLSAAELATMFHIYFLGSSEGLVFDVADDCFSRALWDPLAAHLRRCGASVRTGTSVERVERGGTRRWAVVHRTGTEPPERTEVDGVVLALDVRGLRAVVDSSPDLGDDDWRRRVGRLRTAPPFLVSRFWLDRPVHPARAPFLCTSGFGCLDNISVLERYERTARDWSRRTGGSVVELHSYALRGEPDVERLRQGVLGELRRVYPETGAAGVVDERHEIRDDCPLFPPGGFTDRPPVRTPDPFVTVAGDLTRVDLPVALMERAATSGFMAANVLLGEWGVHGHDLWSVPQGGRWPLLDRLEYVRPAPRRHRTAAPARAEVARDAAVPVREVPAGQPGQRPVERSS